MDIVEEELQARLIAARYGLGFLRDCVCLCGKIFRRPVHACLRACLHAWDWREAEREAKGCRVWGELCPVHGGGSSVRRAFGGCLGA